MYEGFLLTGSDIAVFVINDFNWGIRVEDMTRGTKKELETCYEKNIPIYIAYKRKTDKVLSIYKSEYNGKTLVGIAGTSLMPYNDLKYIHWKNLKKHLKQKEDINEKLELYN